jgi:hypothetical protein
MGAAARVTMFSIMVLIVGLEVLGAGAYLLSLVHAGHADFCNGYAICR